MKLLGSKWIEEFKEQIEIAKEHEHFVELSVEDAVALIETIERQGRTLLLRAIDDVPDIGKDSNKPMCCWGEVWCQNEKCPFDWTACQEEYKRKKKA
ncbi:MAG: hypothetical protein KAR40_09570 [Candidatus Sabulitectum sp.]|nr:hypothetical protein [Candidatus Sabulitectum sp.]